MRPNGHLLGPDLVALEAAPAAHPAFSGDTGVPVTRMSGRGPALRAVHGSLIPRQEWI